MKLGDRVKLVSFNGSTEPLDIVENHEDYWQMIGWAGHVERLNGPLKGGQRVLVAFEANPRQFGLECHNEATHGLWLERGDLELMFPKEKKA